MKQHSRYDLPGRNTDVHDWRDTVIHSPAVKKYGAFIAAGVLMLAIALNKNDRQEITPVSDDPKSVMLPVFQTVNTDSISSDTTAPVGVVQFTPSP